MEQFKKEDKKSLSHFKVNNFVHSRNSHSVKILILLPAKEERRIVSNYCQKMGEIFEASSLEEAIPRIKKEDINLVIVDSSLGKYSTLKGYFKKETSFLITGVNEYELKNILFEWPPERFVDIHLLPLIEKHTVSFQKKAQKAIEHSLLLLEIEFLRRIIERQEIELKEAYFQIKEIKDSISESVVKEIEKRISIESKYIWFKKEKQKIEQTLKKLYKANDVTSLLDVVYDIKDIIRSQGISLYILETSENIGKYLKPLVWNNNILSYPDISKHIVLLDSQDYAAFTARNGAEVNSSESLFDKRLSVRYIKQLGYTLKNLLSIPIRHDEEVIGVLEAYNKIPLSRNENEGFSLEDQQILSRLCEHIAIAISKLNLIQYDPLTGLLRPDPFFEKIIQKIKSESKRRQENSAYALVMGDVDWFKNYNDRNGHEAGNRLLRELARVLKSSIRDEDLLCRYGGEEFLFFLTGIKTPEEAMVFTERIRKNVEEFYFDFQEFQPKNNLTMSFGVTYFSRSSLPDSQEITKNDLKKLANEADLAMAEAKGKKSSIHGEEVTLNNASKNKICLYKKNQKSPQEIFNHAHEEKKVGKERRKHKRYYASTILIFRKDGIQKISKTINISSGGAKISCNIPLSSRDYLDVILILGNKACQCKAKVIYTEKGEGLMFTNYISGIEFDELTFKDRLFLQEYFNSLSVSSSRYS